MLTIKETQDILDMSYPTALDFAKASGKQIGGKWYIPDTAVAARIAEEKRKVDKKEERLKLHQLVKIMQ